MTEFPGRARPDGAAAVAAVGFAAWWWATAVSNDPGRRFGRLRRRVGAFSLLLPDWRFFAPNPAKHDFELLCRVQERDGRVSAWAYAFDITPRVWWQALVHPGRRREKGMFDLISSLLTPVHLVPMDVIEQRPPYRILSAFVEHALRSSCADGELPAGFQFAVVQSGGYDVEADPNYLFASSFVPLHSSAAVLASP